jgi:aspartate/tyrosine/aromatic aminotransferase
MCTKWDELSALFKQKGHLCFFDTAYQGFASGDAERDAYSLRKVCTSQFIVLN